MDVDKPRSTDESLPQNSKGELKIKGQAKRSKSDVLGNSGVCCAILINCAQAKLTMALRKEGSQTVLI
jgi:hypothetical protein